MEHKKIIGCNDGDRIKLKKVDVKLSGKYPGKKIEEILVPSQFSQRKSILKSPRNKL